MKPSLIVLATLVVVSLAGLPTASAQTVGRIRKSLDKATGGATAPAPAPAPVAPAPVVPLDPEAAARARAQAQAAAALSAQRNKAAQAGADARVVEFLKQRVEDGSADAAFDLAKRYDEGKGVTADPKEARKLYTLAAERGNTEAKAWLEAHPAPESEPEPAKAAGASAEKASRPSPPAPSK
jgi:TPR repeat protein